MQNNTLLSLLLIILYGCSEGIDIVPDSNFPIDGIIRVSAESANPATRAGIDSSGDLSQFRLFIKNPNNSRYSYNNIEIRKEGEGFTAYQDGAPLTMYWQNSLSEVSIVSSTLPINDLSLPLNISVTSDQSTPEGIKSSDFLYFKSDRFIPEADLVNGKIPIRFTHMCVRLICTVTLSGNYSTIDEVTISGASLNGIFNFTEGRWMEALDSSPGTIVPYKVSELPLTGGSEKKITYECILIPQTVNRLDIELVIDNRHFNFHTPQSLILENNSSYELPININ